jgi:glycerol-3-phosphate O-acyltransferase
VSEPTPADRAARRYLRELRTRHSPAVHGLWVRAGRALLGRGYERIDYDPAQVERARALLASAPCVVLSSHKSYLDGGALTVGFHDHGLPPLTVFGGINMAFWPLGTLWRRNGMVFVRRGADDPAYRGALRQCLAQLVGERRPLQWFIEGTRSRTGKLGPPRLGLLVYLVDAWREGRIDDLHLLPVAVTYDQLHEVTEYAGEARGAAKVAESLGWLLRFVRAQRGRYGSVYVRFGEPLSLRAALGDPAAADSRSADERRLELARLAFEVSCRINAAMPITGTALVSLALLGARGRALTLRQVHAAVQGYLDYAARRELPRTPTAALETEAAVAQVLRGLVAQGVAQSHEGGRDTVFGLAPEAHLAAAYYRNTIAHHFLAGAIAELALLEAAHRPRGQREAAFLDEALALRSLLEFEFFFRERESYLDGVVEEAGQLGTDWRQALAEGPDGVRELLERAPTLGSDMLLRPFFEAYAIVADVLVARKGQVPGPDARLLEECTGLGRQYVLQRRLGHPETVSRHLFATGLQLARHRGLLDPGSDAGERRAAFAAQLHGVLRRLAVVHDVAVRRVEAKLAAAQRGEAQR